MWLLFEALLVIPHKRQPRSDPTRGFPGVPPRTGGCCPRQISASSLECRMCYIFTTWHSPKSLATRRYKWSMISESQRKAQWRISSSSHSPECPWLLERRFLRGKTALSNPGMPGPEVQSFRTLSHLAQMSLHTFPLHNSTLPASQPNFTNRISMWVRKKNVLQSSGSPVRESRVGSPGTVISYRTGHGSLFISESSLNSAYTITTPSPRGRMPGSTNI